MGGQESFDERDAMIATAKDGQSMLSEPAEARDHQYNMVRFARFFAAS
jgi:hypothetical protein